MLRNKQRAQAIAAFWGKDLKQRDWYAVKMMDDSAEIRIYDIIGWPFVEADQFMNDLSRIDAEDITVRINSPGGDVFDGTAIYNGLSDHPAKITTKIDGLAASMASVIALAGDRREIAETAYYMIHNPWTFAIGDENDLLKAVALLQKIGGTMKGLYAGSSGKDSNQVKAWMDAETWFAGNEAVENGFMHGLSGESGQASARFNVSVFQNAPAKISGGIDKRTIEKTLMQQAGLTRMQARKLLQGGFDSLSRQDAGSGNVDDIAAAIRKNIETITGDTNEI